MNLYPTLRDQSYEDYFLCDSTMIKRDELSLLIPAFLRGELTAREQKEIESLAETDEAFAADIEFQKAIVEAFDSGAEKPQDTEFGWARLSRAIDEASPNTLPTPANDRAPRKFWQYAAALLAATTVTQGVILMNSQSTDTEPQYVMASFKLAIHEA